MMNNKTDDFIKEREAARRLELQKSLSDVPKQVVLEDGEMYWLGATWGKYDAERDIFSLGNTFVSRKKTVYKVSIVGAH